MDIIACLDQHPQALGGTRSRHFVRSLEVMLVSWQLHLSLPFGIGVGLSARGRGPDLISAPRSNKIHLHHTLSAELSYYFHF